MPQLLHAFFGVSRVGFWTHFWGSLVGYLVPLFVVSYFGQRAVDWMRTLPMSAWMTAGAALAVAALVAWAVTRRCPR
jgi:uncharacterized membrane protein YdjX (TVP38/TMEM64 family)